MSPKRRGGRPSLKAPSAAKPLNSEEEARQLIEGRTKDLPMVIRRASFAARKAALMQTTVGLVDHRPWAQMVLSALEVSHPTGKPPEWVDRVRMRHPAVVASIPMLEDRAVTDVLHEVRRDAETLRRTLTRFLKVGERLVPVGAPADIGKHVFIEDLDTQMAEAGEKPLSSGTLALLAIVVGLELPPGDEVRKYRRRWNTLVGRVRKGSDAADDETDDVEAT